MTGLIDRSKTGLRPTVYRPANLTAIPADTCNIPSVQISTDLPIYIATSRQKNLRVGKMLLFLKFPIIFFSLAFEVEKVTNITQLL